MALPVASRSAHIVENGHSLHVASGASDPLEHIQIPSQSQVEAVYPRH